MEELREDDLMLDGLKLLQRPNGYCFTSDSVLLANFVSCKKNDVCVEIGSGSGIISILVNYKNNPQKIYCFEMQKSLYELSKLNIEKNNMQDKIFVINDKVQNYGKYLENGSVSVLFCNPPYFKNNCSIKNADDEKAIARHEDNLKIDELCQVSSKLLKFGGKFFVVYPASRVCELIYNLKLNNLEPKNMYFAQPNQNKNATVVLVQCIKNGKEGVNVLPTLLTNNLDGDYIQTIQKLYKK